MHGLHEYVEDLEEMRVRQERIARSVAMSVNAEFLIRIAIIFSVDRIYGAARFANF